MKQITGIFSAAAKRAGISFSILALLLGAGFWQITAPIATAREPLAPQEMFMSMARASKADYLGAVCREVGRHRADAAQIVRAAVSVRHEFAGDIVSTAIRCWREREGGKGSGKEGPCDGVVEIYRAGVEADPADQASMLEAVLLAAPDCRSAIGQPLGEGEFTNPVGNINPPSGSTAGGGGGFNPEVVTPTTNK